AKRLRSRLPTDKPLRLEMPRHRLTARAKTVMGVRVLTAATAVNARMARTRLSKEPASRRRQVPSSGKIGLRGKIGRTGRAAPRGAIGRLGRKGRGARRRG